MLASASSSGLGARVNGAVRHANQARHERRILAQQRDDVARISTRIADRLAELDEQARGGRQFLGDEDEIRFGKGGGDHCLGVLGTIAAEIERNRRK
jgi:hypothetical protein